MRIGLIYHQFRSTAGGLERYLSGFASRLAEKGHHLTLIGTEFDDSFSSIPGAELHQIRSRGSKTHRMRQFAECSAHASARWKLDISLGFGRTYHQDLHRAGGGCHQVYSRFLPAHKRIRRKNHLELELEKKLYTGGETRHFVVNTALVGKQIQHEYGVRPDQISIIHTPVDTSRFTPSSDPAAEKSKTCKTLGTNPQRPAFLFVSLSHRRKGLAALLEVWPEVDADLWIAGAPLRPTHRRAIKRHRIGGKVHHLGQSGDLVPLYQAADGFLHPTLYDACANTVLQSMACGLPGLISSRDGASEFVRNGENGFLLEDPTDPAQVLRGIHQILQLKSGHRRMMAQAARNTVMPLTWAAHLDHWHSAIEHARS